VDDSPCCCLCNNCGTLDAGSGCHPHHHPHDAIDATTRLRLDGSRIGSGSARIVARSFIDLGCRHLPCDVSHLLGDVVPASPSLEPLELRIDVDGGPSVEPRRTELGVGRAVA
jgi:hypothetical protein